VTRRGLVAALSLVAAAGGIALAVDLATPGPPAVDEEKLRRARMMEELMAARGAIGGPFALADTAGRRRELAEFRGKVVLLYFGYTYCPDVCPTDLAEIAMTLRALGHSAARVQAIYVTVDPERDRGAHLGNYLRAFDDRILGLTGSVEEISAVAERYKAYFAKVPLGQTYVMEHSANFYVLDQDGRFAGSLPPGTSWDRLADVIRERLG
jgi:protein SCO1/2